MNWAQILVIILSVFLAIFLVLAILLVWMLIKVTKQIKSVTDSAQRAAGHIEHMTSSFDVLFLARKVLNMVKKKQKKKE